mmetsp:Transcript_11567/g.46760  ORF Transcript_11567/g.46760 Transcript_11567/m.46760 type:complete len:202 (+) Transcript_11567:617-1222(+)
MFLFQCLSSAAWARGVARSTTLSSRSRGSVPATCRCRRSSRTPICSIRTATHRAVRKSLTFFARPLATSPGQAAQEDRGRRPSLLRLRTARAQQKKAAIWTQWSSRGRPTPRSSGWRRRSSLPRATTRTKRRPALPSTSLTSSALLKRPSRCTTSSMREQRRRLQLQLPRPRWARRNTSTSRSCPFPRELRRSPARPATTS